MAATLSSDLAALVASFSVYRLIHRYADRPSPSLARLTAVIKATSTFHSSIMTIIAIYFLRRCRAQWAGTGSLGPVGKLNESPGVNWHGWSYPDDSTNPLLQTRSPLGNAITAIECGYLLQDTISLLREARLRLDLVQPDSNPTMGLLLEYADKTLLVHHVGIALALLVLQYYTHQDRERGVYIIVQFLLMNGSTPFLNLRWWLRTYHPSSTVLCLGSDLVFIAAFYMARVWLIWWIIRGYGRSHGYDSVWEVFFRKMRLPCEVGTGALWIANTAWWALLVKSVFKRLPKELASVRKAMHVD
ncbi:MAG: hypothetical protein LQ343_005128 [Gyalolechia ehrenbergii]|nr:MAG: hypothetical protein LQ343_005128 [Gyalolechia ehrenbergii]